MEWNVYRHDFNAKEIEVINVFNHSLFRNEVEKLLKKKLNKEEFSRELKRTAMYYFWSKCECEIVLTSWPPYIDKEELNRLNKEHEEYNTKWGHYPYKTNVKLDVGRKIDIYDQLALNWDKFLDYVISFRR